MKPLKAVIILGGVLIALSIAWFIFIKPLTKERPSERDGGFRADIGTLKKP